MVRPFPVLNVLSVLIVVFALAMLLPLCVSLGYGDAARNAYEKAVLITFVSGAILWVVTRSRRGELQTRDGFLLVALVWTVLPAFATLPLLMYMPGLDFTDAYFETVAALTTTGSTVLSGLDKLPPSINLWRCELQWLGGMGIIVLAVAILPLLRNGQRPVAGLRGHDARVRSGFQGGGNGLVRCRCPRVLYPEPGRILLSRRELRLLQFSGDRGCGDFLHAHRRHQFRNSLPRIPQAELGTLPQRPRGGGIRRIGRDFGAWSRLFPVRQPGLPVLLDGATLQRVQRRLGRDDSRFYQHRFQPMANLRARVHAVPLLLRYLFRFHRRRHQDDSCRADGSPGAARAQVHYSSARLSARQAFRPKSGKQHHLRGPGVHVDLGRLGRRHDHAPAGFGPGYRHRFFGGYRLHLQYGARAEPGGTGDDVCGAQRFSDLGVHRRYADRAPGAVYSLHRRHAGVLEKIAAQGLLTWRRSP